MKSFDDVINAAQMASVTQPIYVTQAQHDALEALTVVYMEAAKDSNGVPAEVVKLVMDPLDELWNKLIVVRPESNQ